MGGTIATNNVIGGRRIINRRGDICTITLNETQRAGSSVGVKGLVPSRNEKQGGFLLPGESAEETTATGVDVSPTVRT